VSWCERYDAVVVGAGPSGCVVSRRVAEAGFSVLLVEEHDEVGRPNHCAGLITPRALSLAELFPDSLVQNEFSGAIIRSVSGRKLSIGGDKTHAVAINRPQLDARLAVQAQESGAKLVLGTRASCFERNGYGVRVHLDNSHHDQVVEARLLIGADGANSTVARWAQLPGPSEVVKAVNAVARLPDCHTDFVEVFVGRSIAPGWFGWIIPLGKDHARVGVGTVRGSPTRYLKEIMTAFSSRFRNTEILSIAGGAIPLGLPRRIHSDHTMLVGDAACQVKYTSGGGVYTGLLAARNCADTAARALSEDDLSMESLGRYQTSWLEQMGEEMRLGMLLRRLFVRLGDDDFDRVLHVLRSQTLGDMISSHGDIDHPSRLAMRLVSLLPGLKSLSSLAASLAGRDELVRDVLALLCASR
jgi:digeranylgeranylglycerophospholipid reductase